MSSRLQTPFSYDDLLRLAQSSGPLQGMAQSLLQQQWEEDDRINATGASRSHQFTEDEYGDALMRNLVEQYGEQVVPPSIAEPQQEDLHQSMPANAAMQKWQEHMGEYYPEPGILSRIGDVAGTLASHPAAVAGALGDIVSYGTPFIGNLRGVNEFGEDYSALIDSVQADNASGRTARGNAPDGFQRMMNYGPTLGMDVLQSIMPIGFKGMADRAPGAFRELLQRYGN